MLSDLQAFIQQCLLNFDPTIDLSSGSPADENVVQPILQRLGTDPFTVDIGLFAQALLNQQFPDLPTKEGDAITDLLIKPAIVLWNPIVREIIRISRAQSFQDPQLLTIDEAAALGANLFATPNPGNTASGTVRIYYAQPQDANVTPANFVTDKQGLHYFPTEVQSISTAEMLLNVEGTLYYFDIGVIAEQAGDQYNIAPDSVVTIANLPSAVRITNKLRFRSGTPADDAPTFIGRAQQELTERSLVTSRGIAAVISNAFPDVTSLSDIGFNDPEMQRDIISGGGLGQISASGFLMLAEADGENAITTRRISTSEAGIDFTALIGPPGQPLSNYTLTLHGAFPFGSLPTVRDLTVLEVIDPQTLDLNEQVLSYSAQNIPWTLRQNTLTVSGIPGGILFPNQPDGTLTVAANQIHIGGCTDVYVRGQSLDNDTLILTSIADDEPSLQGLELQFVDSSHVQLVDLVLTTNYSVNDSTYTTLATAATSNITLEILDPPNAGTYRILEVTQVLGVSPILTITPVVTPVAGNYRWNVSSSIFIDLEEPKQTKISGSDLRTVQGSTVVDTTGGTDFANYGVAPNDILRIQSGTLIVGDYTVQAVLSPLFTQVQVDRALPASVTDAQYTIFTPNAGGGLTLPFVRIDSIALLDTSKQPVGTNNPYARPIDIESSGFANSAHGIKADFSDGVLGIVSLSLPAGVNVSGQSLVIFWPASPPQFPSNVTFTVSFTGANPVSLASIASQINGAASTATGGVITRLAVLLDSGNRVGLLPVSPNVQVLSGSAMDLIFGSSDRPITSRDITSYSIYHQQGWAGLRPTLDTNFDVAQVVYGLQVGFYGGLSVPNSPFNHTLYDPLHTEKDFNPEVRAHVQVGSRSLGTARLFFLDPTSFEVDSTTVFTVTNPDGSVLNYFPDPTSNYQRIPSLPNGSKPLDGETGGSLPANVLQSLSTDFVAEGIQPGDQLSIDFIPLVGTVALTDPVLALSTKTLTLSIGGGADKTIIFIQDSQAIPTGALTRAGVVTQINQVVGQTICSLTAGNQLQFNPTVSLTVRAPNPPIQPNTANALLGFSTVVGVDQPNDSPNKATYIIMAVGNAVTGSPNQITVVTSSSSPSFLLSDVQNQQFTVLRVGLQRIVSTAMATNVADAGLYYFDVELLSEGTGDQYNIGTQIQMTATGYRSDGYYLTTDDPNLTFSPIEKPKLHLSRSILEVGTTDSPGNATQLLGQNLQVNYDRSSLANDVNNFVTSDTERVINQSPLARHLIPYFVRFTASYLGGSNTDVTIPDLQTLILGLAPEEALEVSSIQQTLLNRGARVVDNPIDLVAVIHNFDRSITVERSQDKLNTGRLAAFFPDALLVTRRTT